METQEKSLFTEFFAGRLSRRDFLYGAGGLAAIALATPAEALLDKTGLPSDPFTLGVASGDPASDGVVLWTRLAPNPLNGGWQSTRSLAVQWTVSTDPLMQNIVQRGSALASPALGHSVHVELTGLRPATEYWYQFSAGSYKSPIARTKTTPAPGADVGQVRFGLVSCSNFQNGYFAAYKRLAEDNLDVIIHVGDYIYEYDPASDFPDRKHTTPQTPPPAGYKADQLVNLVDYRNRYAQYKSDPSAIAAHHSAPWIVTPDDHEVENNYANSIDEIDDRPNRSTAAAFLLQRSHAYQAYYEHQPLRIASLPQGPDIRLYRKITYGNLVEFNVLDTRQYRTEQTSGFGIRLANDFSPLLPVGGNPTGTLMGATQENWLFDNLTRSTAKWNVVAQQVMMARFNFGKFLPPPTGPNLYNMDQWDGYGAARQRVLDKFDALSSKNFIVLSGDIHSGWATNLLKNFDDATSRVVGTEFVCTSITSSFVGPQILPAIVGAANTTPWIKFFDGAFRGYCRCTITQDLWKTEFVGVTGNANQQVSDPNAASQVIGTRYVHAGTPGATNS